MFRSAIPVVGAVLALIAADAEVAAGRTQAPKYFRVTLSIDQTTTWQVAGPGNAPMVGTYYGQPYPYTCPGTVSGGGSNHITFTTRPVVARFDSGRLRDWLRMAGTSTWTRSGSVSIAVTEANDPPERELKCRAQTVTLPASGCGVERHGTHAVVKMSPLGYGFYMTAGVNRLAYPPFRDSRFASLCPYPHVTPADLSGFDGGFGYIYLTALSRARLNNPRVPRILARFTGSSSIAGPAGDTSGAVTGQTRSTVLYTLVRVPAPRRRVP